MVWGLGFKFKYMKNIAFFLLIFSFLACKKAEHRKCMKSTGENSIRIVALPDFVKLKLKKKLKYILVQNDSTYLKISGGKNMLNLVSWKIADDGFMEIFNENKCNFLRDLKDAITVEIHFKDLNEIMFEGSETLFCPDTLKLNSLSFTILDACGTFNLKIKSNELRGDVAYGWGDYTVEGISENATIAVKSNGFCNVEKLKVNNKYELINESVGDMHVNVSDAKISGYISGKGNIFYKGNPIENEVKLFGEGKMILK